MIIQNISPRRGLTQWGRDKMAAIFRTTFSNRFSWMKKDEFRLRFHWFFFPEGPINNIPALAQIVAWCRSGDKPLSEPMMVNLLTHICVIRPQWVNVGFDPRAGALRLSPWLTIDTWKQTTEYSRRLPIRGRIAHASWTCFNPCHWMHQRELEVVIVRRNNASCFMDTQWDWQWQDL